MKPLLAALLRRLAARLDPTWRSSAVCAAMTKIAETPALDFELTPVTVIVSGPPQDPRRLAARLRHELDRRRYG